MDVKAWVVCPGARLSARFRLFCFPYAGGGASVFRHWADLLDPAIEVCCVHLPGREGRLRERPFTSIDRLVPALAEGLRGLLDRPYAFYGHSLGAKVAFETAREFRRSAARQPVHLFVGSCQAPHLPWLHAPMHALEEQPFLDEVQRRYGGVPQQVVGDPELRALLVPGLRADVTLLETYPYSPEEPLECRITVFGGLEDRITPRPLLDAWRQQTRNAFRLEMVEAGHFFAPSVQAHVLKAIATDLLRSQDRGICVAHG